MQPRPSQHIQHGSMSTCLHHSRAFCSSSMHSNYAGTQHNAVQLFWQDAKLTPQQRLNAGNKRMSKSSSVVASSLPWSEAPEESDSSLSSLEQLLNNLGVVGPEDILKVAESLPEEDRARVAASLQVNIDALSALKVSAGRRRELLHLMPKQMLTSLHMTLSFLHDYGVSPSTLKSMVYSWPESLSQPIYKLGSFFMAMQDIGMTPRLVSSMLTKCPQLLSKPFETQLKPGLDYLQQLQCTNDTLRNALSRAPKLLLIERSNEIQQVVSQLKAAGLTQQSISTILRLNPCTLVLRSDRIPQVIASLQRLGLDATDMAYILEKEPTILQVSPSVLQRKVSFLQAQIGGGRDDLLACPEYLLSSLQHAVGPRFAAACAMHREGHVMVDRGAWEHVGEFLGGGGVIKVGKEGVAEAEVGSTQHSEEWCGKISQRWEGMGREAGGESSSSDEVVVKKQAKGRDKSGSPLAHIVGQYADMQWKAQRQKPTLLQGKQQLQRQKQRYFGSEEVGSSSSGVSGNGYGCDDSDQEAESGLGLYQQQVQYTYNTLKNSRSDQVFHIEGSDLSDSSPEDRDASSIRSVYNFDKYLDLQSRQQEMEGYMMESWLTAASGEQVNQTVGYTPEKLAIKDSSGAVLGDKIEICPRLDLGVLCCISDVEFCEKLELETEQYVTFKRAWQDSVGVKWVGKKW